MKNMQPQPNPIKAYQRKSTAARRVGKNTRCTCGETRIEALVGSSGICIECHRKATGRSIYDKHHVAGKANSDITVKIPAKDHWAILSVAQYDWPKETLENPTGCPLRATAACIRGFIDTVRYLMESLLHWITDLLEMLSALLVERLGPDWWLGTPISQFARKG
ncbi:hypothetical protein [Tunturiibacter gelidiferens]|uniref:Uncharacterized protein n=1 Tax=Tunturiibacter gelidiferens TaxID=3069689 RepID=A0AAU7YX86_9BACT